VLVNPSEAEFWRSILARHSMCSRKLANCFPASLTLGFAMLPEPLEGMVGVLDGGWCSRCGRKWRPFFNRSPFTDLSGSSSLLALRDLQ